MITLILVVLFVILFMVVMLQWIEEAALRFKTSLYFITLIITIACFILIFNNLHVFHD